MARRSSSVSVLKAYAIVMSSSSPAFFAENFAGTVSVFAGTPGTAKAPLTNTLFCAGACSAAPRPPADGFTMRSRSTGAGCGMMVRELVVFSLGVSEVCALPDTVVATDASTTHAVRKRFIANPPVDVVAEERGFPKLLACAQAHNSTAVLLRRQFGCYPAASFI